MTHRPPIDEVLWKLGRLLRSGQLSQWEASFAKSCLGRNARKRGQWWPSERQEHVMRRIVAEKAEPEQQLIEELIE